MEWLQILAIVLGVLAFIAAFVGLMHTIDYKEKAGFGLIGFGVVFALLAIAALQL